MKTIITAALTTLITSFVILQFVDPGLPATAVRGDGGNKSHSESAYDRVMRTGTLKCGYAVIEPYMMKDPATGKLSGIYPDYLAALGKALKINIEWTEEVGWGDFGDSLKNGRIDAYCTSVAATAGRSRIADFTDPLFYMPVVAFTRADETRFDNNTDAINHPSTKIVSIDGRMTSFMAKEDFPNAKQVQLPQLSPQSEQFLYVTARKADITLGERANALLYMKQHPDKLKEIPMDQPLRYYGLSLAVAKGEHDLRHLLNVASKELFWTSKISKILRTHLKSEDALLEVATPYLQ